MAYFKIEYWSTKKMGDIPANLHFWFYIDATVGKPIETSIEEGEEDGYKNFTPTFQKSTKTYKLETGLLSEYMIDAINRMKYYEEKRLTLQTGEIVEMYNVKTSVNYPFADECLGLMTVEFDIDESIVVTGC
jgi:hypothetical protein